MWKCMIPKKAIQIATYSILLLVPRPAYDWVTRLNSHFPSVPLMALTATATLEVLVCLKQLLKDPLWEIASVNKPNITYHVQQIKSSCKYYIIMFSTCILYNYS